LARLAPAWLLQLGGPLNGNEAEALRREAFGSTRERMLREMAHALEAISAERAVVLLIEDLHWSDPSTIDLLSHLAQRRERARLFVLATARPVDVQLASHPLRAVQRELVVRGAIDEIVLETLDLAAIARYLDTRFSSSALGENVARALHARTGGHPLFLVHVVDLLIASGALSRDGDRWIVERDLNEALQQVPDTVKQTIELQIDRLPLEDQRVLEAASAAGMNFSAVAVAAALQSDTNEVEERLDGLAEQGQLLDPAGFSEFPSGNAAARYAFTHALHSEVLYRRLPPGRRLRFHQRIGARAKSSTEIAPTRSRPSSPRTSKPGATGAKPCAIAAAPPSSTCDVMRIARPRPTSRTRLRSSPTCAIPNAASSKPYCSRSSGSCGARPATCRVRSKRSRRSQRSRRTLVSARVTSPRCSILEAHCSGPIANAVSPSSTQRSRSRRGTTIRCSRRTPPVVAGTGA
jgi:hypothetical protein